MENKKIELDLKNPIFVFYINVSGMSRQRADQQIHTIIEQFDIYENVTMWFMPTLDDSKIECVYDGYRKIELDNLIKEINKKSQLIIDSTSIDDIKKIMRDWKIDNIFDDEKK